MKILMVHNFYQHPGGEDKIYRTEVRLLRERGNEVIEYNATNDALKGTGKLKAAINTIWSQEHYRAFSETIRVNKPDVAFFANTFMMISPAAYYACQRARVPVCQHLHNYRIFCPGAVLYRDGHVCQDCIGKLIAIPGILHKCYRGSRGSTVVTAAMETAHKLLGTWQKQVDMYVVATEFLKQKFIEAGWDEEKLIVKQHFLDPAPPVRDAHLPSGDYAFYAGRLTIEKGVMTVLKAWQSLPNVPLKIAGDGPIMNEMKEFAKTHNVHQVEFLGHQDNQVVQSLMRNARCVLFPSEWYETFGLVAIEAFAAGIPVITANIGSQASIVEDGKTGWHFKVGDANDLAAKVQLAFAPQTDVLQMGRMARQVFEEKYTADVNYRLFIEIFDRVLSQR